MIDIFTHYYFNESPLKVNLTILKDGVAQKCFRSFTPQSLPAAAKDLTVSGIGKSLPCAKLSGLVLWNMSETCTCLVEKLHLQLPCKSMGILCRQGMQDLTLKRNISGLAHNFPCLFFFLFRNPYYILDSFRPNKQSLKRESDNCWSSRTNGHF